MSADQLAGFGFETKIGQKHRVLAWHGTDVLRPIAWFQFGRDGSLYLGPYLPKAGVVRTGKVESPDGFIGYDMGEPIEHQPQSPTKISIHASGTIHYAGRRDFQESYRGIQRQRHVCSMLFGKPSTFPVVRVSEVRKKDFVLNFHISDDHPFQCGIYLSPSSQIAPVDMKDARQQFLAVALCTIDGDPKQIALQLHLSDRDRAPWPPASYFVAKTMGQPTPKAEPAAPTDP